MTKAGFSYTQKQPAVGSVSGTDWDDFLGVADMAQAQALGYVSPLYEGDSQDPSAQAKENGIVPTSASRDPAYLVALYGAATARVFEHLPADPSLNDDNGCLTKADNALAPSGPKPDMNLQSEGWAAAKAEAQADPAVLADLAQWQACMRQAGYQVTSIPQPTDTTTTAASISEAVTDVTCKDSSGLTDTYITTLYAAERAYISDHQAEFDAMQAYSAAQAQAAAAVLAGK